MTRASLGGGHRLRGSANSASGAVPEVMAADEGSASVEPESAGSGFDEDNVPNTEGNVTNSVGSAESVAGSPPRDSICNGSPAGESAAMPRHWGRKCRRNAASGIDLPLYQLLRDAADNMAGSGMESAVGVAGEGNELPSCLGALSRTLAFLFHSSNVQCVPLAAGEELRSGREYMVKSIAVGFEA